MAMGFTGLITGNTVLAPKIWEGIDFHGDYNVIITENKVFGGSAGIKTGASSGGAANYAGYNTIIANNIVTTRNEDGTPGSPTNLQYGIVAQGGSASSHKRIVISGNIVQGYGNAAATTASESILINTYAEQFVVRGNVISDWIGIAISISTGATVGVVNDNMFSSMSAASASSNVIRIEGATSGRFVVMGNVLETGGNAPALGLRATGTVTALVTYGSDFRAAGTEVSVAGGTVRQVQYA